METVDALAARLRISFGGRILLIGYGGVSQCTLPLLLRHIDMPRDRITVMDMVDCSASPALAAAIAEGVRFVQERITQEGFAEQLSAHVGPGDMIIDLAWNIGCTDILEWCHRNDVLYVNTSVELWNPYAGMKRKRHTDRTLYVRHMAIRQMVQRWGSNPGATAILEHGANPGLVSHFTKRGLTDIARKLLIEKPRDPRIKKIQVALESSAYNQLAKLLNVKVIHISEIDTQVSSEPHDPEEFANTWSVEGFFEEGTAPAEMGWGTHERVLPADAHEHKKGPRNQICLSRFGINTFVRSCVPSQEIVGMVVRHGEAFTISDFLTVFGQDGEAVYRPTVHYAYLPCRAALDSLNALRARDCKLHEKYRIMNDDIVGGTDELGVLLMGHDFQSWWAGTNLSIEETRRLVPGQNATTLQVAASVLGAVFWMIRNPRKGVLIPDQLPHEEILHVADPYLGSVVSLPINWSPSQSVATTKTGKASGTKDDVWQFENFLLTSPPAFAHAEISDRR